MILIFYITHKVISLHGENRIGERNDITPVRSHGGTILIDAYAGWDSKPLLLSNLRTTKMNDDVLAILVSADAKYILLALLDRMVKFELLLTLEGHHADVWCLAISNSGDYIVTGSHDRSICHWDSTKEPISLRYFLVSEYYSDNVEEKEKRLEQMFESDLDNAMENSMHPRKNSRRGSSGLRPGRKLKKPLQRIDLIIEALDIAKKNWIVLLNMRKSGGNVLPEFQPDIRMLGLSPSHYVLRTLSNVKTNDLEQTLLGITICGCSSLSYLKD
ncbi:hypothetical protein Pint_17878 [Pistacia integerrima]|uniref:Uncharacterized protein n=1 Tax=Pistacia integerrima TaxID=434235 RepID=A0ACC0YZ92_9ROSI|nr:hypothetical protein Pint_17878 [Pistacia integerrima]